MDRSATVLCGVCNTKSVARYDRQVVDRQKRACSRSFAQLASPAAKCHRDLQSRPVLTSNWTGTSVVVLHEHRRCRSHPLQSTSLGPLTRFRISGCFTNYALTAGTLHQWMTSYLTDRNLQAVVGGATSSRVPVTAGVPQGSILGQHSRFTSTTQQTFYHLTLSQLPMLTTRRCMSSSPLSTMQPQAATRSRLEWSEWTH